MQQITFTIGPGLFLFKQSLVPGVINSLDIKAWAGCGGGGTGGAAVNNGGNTAGGGCGGGGGGYAHAFFNDLNLVPPTFLMSIGLPGNPSQSISIAEFGAPLTGPPYTFVGGDGGDTWVGSPAIINCTRGTGGGPIAGPQGNGGGATIAATWNPLTAYVEAGGNGGFGRESNPGDPGIIAATVAGSGGGGGSGSQGGVAFNGGNSIGPGSVGIINGSSASGFKGAGAGGVWIDSAHSNGDWSGGNGGNGDTPGILLPSGGGGGGAIAGPGSGVATGIFTGGGGGQGSPGQVIISATYTPFPAYYFNWDLVTWYHMMNMARPISLTGRYKS